MIVVEAGTYKRPKPELLNFGIKVKHYACFDNFVRLCNPKEHYIFITNNLTFNVAELEVLQETALLHPYAFVQSKGAFCLRGYAIKECQGNWDRLEQLGYEVIKI